VIPGLSYITNFIALLEQEFLIKELDQLPWSSDLKRRTQHYGYKYDYTKKKLDQSAYVGPIPEFLRIYISRLAKQRWFDEREKPDQIIVNEYLPGQGISKHIDCVSCFADTIASISLNSSCIMDFEKNNRKGSLLLEPLSLLVLSDEARYEWTHAIPAHIRDIWKEQEIFRGRRISLTFRKVIIS
jgi:alkylated DNA repair dioxygenase AlkB